MLKRVVEGVQVKAPVEETAGAKEKNHTINSIGQTSSATGATRMATHHCIAPRTRLMMIHLVRAQLAA